MTEKTIHKNFLLITNIYPPAFAPRMGYMLKYLTRKGWNATVITRPEIEDKSFQSLVDLVPKPIRLNVGKLGFTNRFEAIKYNLFYPIFFYLEAYKIYREAQKQLKHQSFDFVLCCISYHQYMLQASYWLATRNKIPLFIDFRDLEEQRPDNINTKSKINRVINYYKGKFVIRRRNKLISNASIVTSVTPWHETILSQYTSTATTIYNGFDHELFFPANKEKCDIFEIIYTGTIHKGIQDLDLFFEILLSVKNSNQIANFNNLKISFYSPKSSRGLVIKHKKFSKLAESINFYDYVDTTTVAKLLRKSSILLLLSNIANEDGQKGLESTTKYFEYLAVKKPILCTRSDEASLEASIMALNAGCAARTAEQGAQFIIEKYREWLSKGYTTQDSDYQAIQAFSREKQAYQFEELFLAVLNDKN